MSGGGPQLSRVASLQGHPFILPHVQVPNFESAGASPTYAGCALHSCALHSISSAGHSEHEQAFPQLPGLPEPELAEKVKTMPHVTPNSMVQYSFMDFQGAGKSVPVQVGCWGTLVLGESDVKNGGREDGGKHGL